MVAGPIIHKDGVLPELRVLLGQDGHELGEVGHDDRLVVVGLGKRHVGMALRVEAADNVDVLGKVFVCHSVFSAPRRPLPTTKVQVRTPALIDAEESLVLRKQGEHRFCVVLP